LGHPDPSGDLVTAQGLFGYLSARGHRLEVPSTVRCRWIYWKPWLWPRLLREKKRFERRLRRRPVDLWLTYHSYYKAPDLLGPAAAKRWALPYVVFQAAFSTKRRRRLKTLPGFWLNRAALRAADRVMTNKHVDVVNLKRVLPEARVTYVAPGIDPDEFQFDPGARRALRRQWQVGADPVLVSAAMFRPDVKTRSLAWLIQACGALYRRGRRFHLIIAGDGSQRPRLENLVRTHLPGRVRFVGKIARSEMYRFYSAGDLFAFPGIGESLGMVFLEAQSCGLPVVAFNNAGLPEVVRDRVTGFLQPMYAVAPFVRAIDRLLGEPALRAEMGEAARTYIRECHDLKKNYRGLERELLHIASARGSGRDRPLPGVD
jgi:glycosyltransferase involved in cell wall biosynthesis